MTLFPIVSYFNAIGLFGESKTRNYDVMSFSSHKHIGEHHSQQKRWFVNMATSVTENSVVSLCETPFNRRLGVDKRRVKDLRLERIQTFSSRPLIAPGASRQTC